MFITRLLYFSTKSWTTLSHLELELWWWEYFSGGGSRSERPGSWAHNRQVQVTVQVKLSRGRSRVTSHYLSDTCLGKENCKIVVFVSW